MNESTEVPGIGEQPTEAAILEALRTHGDSIAKRGKQITALELEQTAELSTVNTLYRQFTSSEAISTLAGTIIEENPLSDKKKDKRKEYNPIKNLNIGVRLSYRHQKQNNHNAEDARDRVYRSIVETAIKKGIHTDDSTADNPKKVSCIQDLPKKVIEKIEQGYKEYNQGRKSKAKKSKAA